MNSVDSELLFDRRDLARAQLVGRAAHSFKWSFLYNALPRLITPFSTMILAALLTPADFGLVAISSAVIALAKIIVDLGLGQALIQRKARVEEAFSTALSINMFISGILFVALWFLSPSLAGLYNNAKAIDIIRVAAVVLPLVALENIPITFLRRKLEFRRLFWISSSNLVITSIASVLLAVLGAGVWALIWGPIIGTASGAALAWKLSKLKPIFIVYKHDFLSMLSFSAWVLMACFLNWLFVYAGNAIGGLFLSVEELGIYSLGFTAAILIPSFLSSALNDVAYPTFCTMQENPKVIGEDLLKVQALAGAVVFPVTLGLSAIAPSVVQLLYGSKWSGLGFVISILVIMPGMGFIWSLNEAAYQAVGRPDLWTKVTGISLLAVLPLLWLTAAHGLQTFTFARFIGAWVLPLGHIFISTKVLGVGIRNQLRAFSPPLVASVGMYIAVIMLLRLLGSIEGLSGWLTLSAVVFIGIFLYLLFVRFLQRDLLARLLLNFRRVMS